MKTQTVSDESTLLTRRRWLVRVVAGGVWVVGVVLAIKSGWDPGFWGAATRPWMYPVAAVLIETAKITVLSLALYDILRPRPEGSALARTVRGFGALLVMFVWEGLFTMTDQPGYAYVTGKYILILAGLLFIALMVQLAVRSINRGTHAA